MAPHFVPPRLRFFLLLLAVGFSVYLPVDQSYAQENTTVPSQPAATEPAAVPSATIPATAPVALTPAPAVPASPKPALVLTTRAGVHPDFDRLVFDAGRNLAYKLERDGTKVMVHFSVAATISLRPFAAAKLTLARDFAVNNDAVTTVSFQVDAKAKLKDFTSGSAIVIDVLKTAVPVAAAAIPAATTPSPTPAAETVVPETKPAEPKTSEAVAEVKPAEAGAAEPAVTPVVDADKNKMMASAIVNTGPQTMVLSPTTPAVVPDKTVAALPAEVIKPELEAVPKAKLPEFDIGYTPELVATFDPNTITGAAVFARGGYGYILFDRKLTFDLNALTGKDGPRLPMELVDLRRTNGYRFLMPPEAEIRATRVGTAWKIYLSKQRSEISVSAALVAQPDFALGARILFPVPDAPEPVRFTDPVIGDDLIAVPLLETQAFSVPRSMADFDILSSAQGLVIKPLHEKVTVRSVSDGVEIAAIGGLKLSRASDTGASRQSAKKARAAAAGKSVFDFAGWGSKPNENFTMTRQRLTQTIVDVPEVERNRARLDLARLYFTGGMGQETLALLNYLAEQVPDLPTHAEFLALRGAANILANHPQEGLRDLSDSQLTYQPEIELWQAVAAAQLRDWTAAEEKFSIAESVLSSYPEPFYSRFFILAIEAALATDKDREAAEWLDQLETGNYDPQIRWALQYLRGVLFSKTGRSELAQTLWKNVAKAGDHLYKTRAELALVDLGVATNSLTPIQAAERLEGLRFAWRGDDLELDILHRLGNFYLEAKRYREGLTILAQAVRLYPTSPMTQTVRQEMGAAFHDIFLGDVADNMTPVEALTLFQDFRELMPTGDDGKAVIRNLAERLVAIDLLEQAASLLENQVKGDLQGEEKAKVGTRLAAIRLLDHNANAALEALEMSQVDGMSTALQTERLLLRSRALSELGKGDEALELLAGNDSQNAKLLRADITMRAQHWAAAVTALQELIGPPPPAGAKLSEEQAQWLVDCAIALSLANDVAGLDRLAIDFGQAMAETSQKDTFRILTRPEKGGQLRDIAAAQARLTEVDMFQSFLDSYRSDTSKDKEQDGKKNGDKKAEAKSANTQPEKKKSEDKSEATSQ